MQSDPDGRCACSECGKRATEWIRLEGEAAIPICGDPLCAFEAGRKRGEQLKAEERNAKLRDALDRMDRAEGFLSCPVCLAPGHDAIRLPSGLKVCPLQIKR